jgi:uncharacterized membrane protein
MGKHEIRLRRQRLTARGSERFRNYNAVLKQHEEGKKIKMIVRLFTFFLIIAALVLIFVVVTRWESKKNTSHSNTSSAKIVSLKM